MRPFKELNRPLYGKYSTIRHHEGKQTEKHLAGAFYPLAGFGYGRSQAFRQSTPLGSVFKLITGYSALKEIYPQKNPLTLIDSIHGNLMGYTLDGKPIHRMYKGGLLPRSHPNIGKIDLVGAIEQSSNLYFAILAGDHIGNPDSLIESAKSFGFGTKSAIDLPGEFPGLLPKDLSYNKTGLYSFAIGQHSLVVTPLQTAVMLSTLANGGDVLKPQIALLFEGKDPHKKDLFPTEDFPFEKSIKSIGLDFSLFTEALKQEEKSHILYKPKEIKKTLFLPEEIRFTLFKGMQQVLLGPKGTARPSVIRQKNSHLLKTYMELQDRVIGKTGTAEILYKHTVDKETKAEIRNQVWFGCISFAKDDPHFEKPQL